MDDKLMKDVFSVLSAVNVDDKVEVKSKLTYLPWAEAWSEVKKKYPTATYNVSRFENDLPYVYDPKTGYMVFTQVEIEGLAHEMWLPVMDGANKAMKDFSYQYTVMGWVNNQKKEIVKDVEAATMFDINKTIMRCLTKNLAMFGLGLYIYSKEEGFTAPISADAADVASNPTPTAEKKKKEVRKPATPTASDERVPLVLDSENWTKVLNYIAANKAMGLEKIVKQLERKYTIEKVVINQIKTTIDDKPASN